MKTIVAILVYDRLENIKTWIKCWKQCEHENAELVIVHNFHGESEKITFRNYCVKNNVRYIPRANVGFDIGAFQDVCRQRLEGFPKEWENLLWVTDDTIPMQKDFLARFLKKLTPDVGVVCTEISPYVRTHIRTTGFLLRKSTAVKLVFPVDPVKTKEQCYQFEHRSENIFYTQVIRMGLKVVMADIPQNSPLWDMGYKRGLKRGKEHGKIFPNQGKITFICLIYNSYPQIISSLICQLYKNWEMVLIHDGPNETGLKDFITDKRIKYIETKERGGKWGHPLRQWALKEVKEGRMAVDSDYIVITNGDNYHMPEYCSYMLEGFTNNPEAVAVYCSDMIHNYVHWNVIPCSPKLGYIDCAGVMVRKDVAGSIGWRDIESHSSDWTYFEDIIKKHGIGSFIKIPGCLLVHN